MELEGRELELSIKINEYTDRLDTIQEMINSLLNSDRDILVSTKDFLDKIKLVAQGKELPDTLPKDQLSHVVISCDASITKNPDGQAAIGFVIEVPGLTPIKAGKRSRSKTINQAEYDAVYEGIVTLFNLHNNPGPLVEVRSDSQLVIRQLTGAWVCNDPVLQRRKEAILELVSQLPSEVQFVWRPRNSTPSLEEANYLAQDTIGVPRK